MNKSISPKQIKEELGVCRANAYSLARLLGVRVGKKRLVVSREVFEAYRRGEMKLKEISAKPTPPPEVE